VAAAVKQSGVTTTTIPPVDLAALERAEPGWTRLHLANSPAVTGGPAWDWLTDHPERLRFATFRAADGALTGRAWFGPGCQGPPGHAHGGSLASLLDLVMGGAAWAAGFPVVAAHLDIRYGRSVPLGRLMRFDARVERREKRVVHASGSVTDADGVTYTRGSGRFVILRRQQLADFRAQQPPGADGVVWAGNPGLTGELAEGY